MKTKTKEKRKLKKRRLREFSDKLNTFRPKSETWFLDQLSLIQYPLWIWNDSNNKVSLLGEPNKPFGGYIPDFINKDLKFIIEVDGSIHELEKVKRKDQAKTERYQRHKFKVFRVIHNDYNSLNLFINEFTSYLLLQDIDINLKHALRQVLTTYNKKG